MEEAISRGGSNGGAGPEAVRLRLLALAMEAGGAGLTPDSRLLTPDSCSLNPELFALNSKL